MSERCPDLELADIGPHGKPEGGISDGKARRGLGVGSIVFLVVAAAAPLSVVVGSFPIVILYTQGTGLPLFLLACAVMLLVFSVGFTAMSKYVPNAGALYAFVTRGLGPVNGVGAAFMAIIGYMGAFLALVAYFGASIAGVVQQLGGPATPWWVWALVCAVLVGVLGYRNIELGAKVLSAMLIAEFLIVIILDVAIIAHGGQAGLSLAPFDPTSVSGATVGLGIVLAMGSFIGFEATVVFRGEARDPDRTIPRATYLSVAIIAIFYTVSAWAIILGAGGSDAVAAAAADPQNMVFTLAQTYAGPVIRDIMQVLLLTSFFAAILSFHNVLARYAFTLGKQELLPKALGTISAKHGAPSRASLVLSLILVVVVIALAITGVDPILQVYAIVGSIASIGIIALLTLTSLSIIVFFRRRPRAERPVWSTLIAPVLAFLALGTVTVTTVVIFPTITGSPAIAAALIGVVVGVYIIGMVVALTVRKRNPEAYARISDN